ncbi:MAG: putative toxin-antitoxin system toxin component, PIN family [Synergistaceae bacterium]|nr:putative toxin-antitoxin system toxin component, PIN family [Synergistaceae bacterium]MBQ9574674.1 putative toxin-antitoxin system toxin component, PIN family [Synergistaceae bacterium]
MVDTNILFSAMLLPKSVPAKALLRAVKKHRVILCDRNISELKDILRRKAPNLLPYVDDFLAGLQYEHIPVADYAGIQIRDENDQLILNAAIVYDADIILTGDKDFLSLDIEHPKCVPPSDFLKLFDEV